MATVMVSEPEGLAAGCVGSSSLPGTQAGGTSPAAAWLRGAHSPLFLQDKTLKCTVYRIRGTVSAGNYIQLPKTSSQSLGLTGRYLYLLFRPLSASHFVIHLDLSTEVLSSGAGSVVGALHPRGPLLSPYSHALPLQDRQVIRVSLSSLFKEFKSTATWLQFPFICEGTSRKGDSEMGHQWNRDSPGETARGQTGK